MELLICFRRCSEEFFQILPLVIYQGKKKGIVTLHWCSSNISPKLDLHIFLFSYFRGILHEICRIIMGKGKLFTIFYNIHTYDAQKNTRFWSNLSLLKRVQMTILKRYFLRWFFEVFTQIKIAGQRLFIHHKSV